MMEKEKIRLVICDVDGTLYDWDRILSPRTERVINTLHERGYGFGIASGRPYEEIVQYAGEWGFSFPFDVLIGLNGAQLYTEKEKVLHEYYRLSSEKLKKAAAIMARFECNPFLYRNGKLVCLKIDDMIIKSSKTSRREIEVVPDISALCAEENAKIMFRMSEEETRRAEEWLAEHPDPDFNALKTQSTLLEFMDPRISKGFGIRRLCDLGEYQPQEILAFGDTTNDNAMLEEVGWGVCMCNGSEDTKAAADDITAGDCAHDGFAEYVETHLL